MYSSWFTSSHRRQKLYRSYTTERKNLIDLKTGLTFKDTRKALHKALSKSRDQYTSEFLVDACKTSHKAFWSHIKKVRNKEVGVVDLEVGGKLLSDAQAFFVSDDMNNISSLGSSIIPDIDPLISVVMASKNNCNL